MSGDKHSCGLDIVGACTACEQDVAAPSDEQHDTIPDLGEFVDWVWALKTERGQLKAEGETLRKIISESAAASGASLSVECSLTFMQHLPAEIGCVVTTLRDRAAYWRQRAKSAEGHLYASDFQAACDALHLDSNYADTPPEQLTEVQKARISSAVHVVLRAVNAQRDRRRPADVTDQRDNQNLKRQEE
ncbi:hypothetical protein VSO52_17500 [Pseudomonas fulva]|uniref:hypothetical protein n=1 Tax=Pseudomonas fulva TaxID=47880 RepID=UPI002DBBF8C8|nr:hypothetical protein [Pseudomonas fulva]MEC4024576.1 hypothetical protein [Pseudomonas fulva]